MVFFDLHMGSPDGIELSVEMRRTGSNRTTPAARGEREIAGISPALDCP